MTQKTGPNLIISIYFFPLKLESEIRVRENRDAKLLLDTQEVVLSREREKELRTQISRLQNELERDRAKAKTLQDKVDIYICVYVETMLLVEKI